MTLIKRITTMLGILLVSTSLVFASHTVPNITDFVESEWYSAQCPAFHLMNQDVMHNIQLLRDYMNQPLIITSAYRCHTHPIEYAKLKPGQHSKGLAVDIYVTDSYMAAKIIAFAIKELNVKGFAYSKHGKFVHLDWRTGDMVTWNY